MNSNIKSVIKACDINFVNYEFIHKNKNLLRVNFEQHSVIFCNWTAPVNSQSIARLCEDKDYSYSVLSSYIDMPETCAYLDPNTEEKYKNLLEFKSEEEIAENIIQRFDFPVIIKRNRGAHGNHVFLSEGPESVGSNLKTIFRHDSKDYDYIALAQQHIEIAQEFRAVFFDYKLQFAYLKSTENAAFTGNLSPLHWDGAQAIEIHDKRLLDSLEQFTLPALKYAQIIYAGVDLVIDTNGKMWCIEVNASPGFGQFTLDCGDQAVINLYGQMLDYLSKCSD